MKTKGLLAPQYRDEMAARAHIEKTRWPDGPICPHCGVENKATKLEPRANGKTHVRKGVYQCNAWFMVHRIRWALTQDPIKGKLSGTVEADETYVGGKLRTVPMAVKPGERPKDRLSGTANKAAVMSVLQRGGSGPSQYVERVTAKNIKPIIEEMVSEDAHLMTDSSHVLAGSRSGRRHSQVNHTAGEYGRMEDGALISTNSVESYFAVLKRGNYGVYHH